jgi:hypothetical protein
VLLSRKLPCQAVTPSFHPLTRFFFLHRPPPPAPAAHDGNSPCHCILPLLLRCKHQRPHRRQLSCRQEDRRRLVRCRFRRFLSFLFCLPGLVLTLCEGTNTTTHQPVAVKFVRICFGRRLFLLFLWHAEPILTAAYRNLASPTHHSCATSTAHTAPLTALVSLLPPTYRRVKRYGFLLHFSGSTASPLLWSRGSPQCPRHRPPRS